MQNVIQNIMWPCYKNNGVNTYWKMYIIFNNLMKNKLWSLSIKKKKKNIMKLNNQINDDTYFIIAHALNTNVRIFTIKQTIR